MKKIILKLILAINAITNILPRTLKSKFIFAAIIFEGYSRNPEKDLSELLLIKDDLEKIINNRALAYGNGEHPKHYLTGYHDFFVKNIKDGESVLDVGCGYGAVARTIAIKKPNSVVEGIDNDQIRLNQAIKANNPKNLTFSFRDATINENKREWDIVVLSNVLEHIENRVDFLRSIQSSTLANKILIRVPSFERDWQVPLRKKLGINYFTDNDHKIEHTLSEFEKELSLANLELLSTRTIWGEIWAVCRTNIK